MQNVTDPPRRAKLFARGVIRGKTVRIETTFIPMELVRTASGTAHLVTPDEARALVPLFVGKHRETQA